MYKYLQKSKLEKSNNLLGKKAKNMNREFPERKHK